MKRNLGLIVLLTLLVVCSGCTSANAPVEESVKASDEKATDVSSEASADGNDQVKIGFTILGMKYPYFGPLAENAVAKGKELGVEVVIFDAEVSSDKQTSQIRDMVTQDFDAICIIPCDAQSSVPAIKEAVESDIPVVGVNIQLAPEFMEEWSTYLGYDMFQHGFAAGESLSNLLGEEGGRVVRICSNPAHESQKERLRGFEAGIENNPNIEVLDTQASLGKRDKAMEVMENYLIAYDDIDAVFVTDDNQAMGVVQAIKAAGKTGEIQVVSIGGSKEGLDAVRSGDIASTVFQDPAWEGYHAIETALKLYNGEEVDKRIIRESPAVTADNADDFVSIW